MLNGDVMSLTNKDFDEATRIGSEIGTVELDYMRDLFEDNGFPITGKRYTPDGDYFWWNTPEVVYVAIMIYARAKNRWSDPHDLMWRWCVFEGLASFFRLTGSLEDRTILNASPFNQKPDQSQRLGLEMARVDLVNKNHNKITRYLRQKYVKPVTPEPVSQQTEISGLQEQVLQSILSDLQ